MARPKTSICGTRSAYIAGCRCDECRAASAAYYREWTKTEAGARWKSRTKTGEMARRHRIKFAYGITVEQFDAMAEAQGWRCFLCREAKELTVDHDHATGKIRGLLCRNCNAAIGKLGDDAAGLRRALVYVEDNS